MNQFPYKRLIQVLLNYMKWGHLERIINTDFKVET